MIEERSSQYYMADDGLWRGIGMIDNKYYINDIGQLDLLSAVLDIEEMMNK